MFLNKDVVLAAPDTTVERKLPIGDSPTFLTLISSGSGRSHVLCHKYERCKETPKIWLGDTVVWIIGNEVQLTQDFRVRK